MTVYSVGSVKTIVLCEGSFHICSVHLFSVVCFKGELIQVISEMLKFILHYAGVDYRPAEGVSTPTAEI